jgi:hypothetical protein
MTIRIQSILPASSLQLTACTSNARPCNGIIHRRDVDTAKASASAKVYSLYTLYLLFYIYILFICIYIYIMCVCVYVYHEASFC